MIEPTVSLAFSLHSTRGVYALLLGSGVSRSAGIPTGWEVALDLIRKMAHIKGEDCEPDPQMWYKKTFSQDPDYSQLLDDLAKSSADRQQLLKGYFEPTEEEREQGLKMPAAAHKAIAELVSGGHVRVIITTNFDRLLEKAIEAKGTNPIVISTADAARGALPLIHSSCSIIKIHGDYLDPRIKNTTAELEQYDDALNSLLDRVFDEFGLIVCGWSGEWDTALRGLLERCRNRRFTTYWTLQGGGASDSATRLINLRQATVVPIKDADTFFTGLVSKVKSLDEIARPHPLSSRMAVATLKRHLTANQKIPVHDLVMAEVEKAYAELSPVNFPLQGAEPTGEEFAKRLDRYEAIVETLQAILISGCYWAGEIYNDIWINCLQRISNPSGDGGGFVAWSRTRYYPALLLFYSIGLAATASNNYSAIQAVLSTVKIRDGINETPIALTLNSSKPIEPDWVRKLPRMAQRNTPMSDRLWGMLRKPFAELLPDDLRYHKTFDRWEYLLALIYADLSKREWVPPGRFAWNIHGSSGKWVPDEVDAEMNEMQKEWLPLKAGLFGGDLERLKAANDIVHKFVQNCRWA